MPATAAPPPPWWRGPPQPYPPPPWPRCQPSAWAGAAMPLAISPAPISAAAAAMRSFMVRTLLGSVPSSNGPIVAALWRDAGGLWPSPEHRARPAPASIGETGGFLGKDALDALQVQMGALAVADAH